MLITRIKIPASYISTYRVRHPTTMLSNFSSNIIIILIVTAVVVKLIVKGGITGDIHTLCSSVTLAKTGIILEILN